jgi:protein involved in polysaccharide export with SLBB domain
MSVSRLFTAIWMGGLILTLSFAVSASAPQVTMSRLDSLRLEHKRASRPLPSHDILMSVLDSLRLRQAISARGEMEREQVLDKNIDPEEYAVGPGDELILSLWGEISESFLLEITPEGKVLIPQLGEILVRQLTLAQARDKIIEAVSKRYRNVIASVSLTKVRKFRVFVVGAVNLPGTYTATAVDRVSMLIDQAGGLAPGASRRNVQVKRQDSNIIGADLLRFIVVGDLGANPYVVDGDVVNVPVRVDSVGVFGAVNVEGYYELKDGDRISDLVEMSRGLVRDVYMEEAELVRFREDRKTAEHIFLDLAKIVEEKDPEHNLFLQSDDVLLVRRIPEWHPEYLVEVRGEAVFPGHYAIEQNKTHLSEVIERAGGLKPSASLNQSKLIRTLYEGNPDLEFERLREMRVAEMSDDEYSYFKTKSRQLHQVVVVDFEGLFLKNDKSADVLLKRGDIIDIPAIRKTVEVNGLVNDPGAVQYRPGKRLGYYIDQAGGYHWNARKSRVRVIKGSTGQWLKPSRVKGIEPGDIIWVPEKPERDYWDLFKDFVRVSAEIATVVLVAHQVTK